jgi:hypothetical protein
MKCTLKLAALLVLALSGCNFPPSISELMAPIPKAGPVPAPDGYASVVFIKASGWPWGTGAHIVNEQGRYLGITPDNGWFQVNVRPGRHTFVGFLGEDSVDSIDADLAAGSLYFVEVYFTPGVFSPQTHLKVVKPSTDSWAKRDKWLNDGSPYASRRTGQERVVDRFMGPERMQHVMAKAEKSRAAYAGNDQNEHVLAPGDGLSNGRATPAVAASPE